ncbi:MAG: hypothetical protein WCG87_09635, partial [Bacteroidota bacterium]
LAGSVIMFAACNNASTEKPAENVDSIANAKAEQMRGQMAAKNDSIINAMAKAKADSTEAAMKAEEAKKEEEAKHSKGAHHDKAKHETKKDEPKAAAPAPSNTPKTVNDRPGGNSNNAPKSVNDRPGGNK